MASTIIQSQDLSSDRLLGTAPRIPFDDKEVPAIAGIPLIAKLGQGGMGAVYVGMHPRLKKEVAIKVLPFPLMAQQPDMVDRFYREAQIAARVKSNHLVGVLDVNSDKNGLFYIIMEFVHGPSAGAYLKQLKKSGCEGLKEAEALDICIAATTGLAAAHAEGIIHRDVKPDNILIPHSKSTELQFKHAKLADLGLARSEELGESLTGTRTALGTPGYMAPEQCMDAKKAQKPADIFSMGATLYALLSGRAPFTGETPMEAVLATLQKPVQPLKVVRPDISAQTAAVVQRCLEKEPQRRYQNGAELLAELKKCRSALDEKAFQPAISAAAGIPQATRIQVAPKWTTQPVVPSAPAAQNSPAPATRQTGFEPTLAMTPKPEAPPAPANVSYLASLAAKPGPVPRPAPQSVRPSAPVSHAFRNLAAAVFIAAAGAAAWHFWVQSMVSPPQDPKPVVKSLPTATPVAAPPTQLLAAATTEKIETPAPVEVPAKPAGPDYSKMTTEQRLQALAEALPQAQTAKQSGDWQRVVELLDGPVFSLADATYPSKAEATALQMQAHVEVMRHSDFKEKLKQADALLAAGKFDEARAAYEAAKTIWPKSPEIARANKGIEMANNGVSVSLYDQAMREGRSNMEARSFASAASNFRKALREKPGDSDAESALKDATAQALKVANTIAKRLPPPPPMGDDGNDFRGNAPPGGPPMMITGGVAGDMQTAINANQQNPTPPNQQLPPPGPSGPPPAPPRMGPPPRH